ncbi:YihY/virulence factor BrkB family protein [Spirosoma soli]|uniref:YihY/virulence factor BrkB family protein n=1 Tax=Spirosoma soli TaxID=1770529 RepID=A0ABW5LXG5_9BACT
MKKVAPIFQLAVKAFDNLKANDPIRMAAATAFFTFFALPAIVIILSQLYGGLFNEREQRFSGQLFRKLADLFGYQSARQIQDISQHLQQRRSSEVLTILSGFILLLASTTLFAIIKNSLNQLWNVKPTTGKRVLYTLVSKLVALGIILFSGILFVISLKLHRLLSSLQNRALPEGVNYEWLGNGGHHLLSAVVLTIWFAFVFKFLPDIRIRWRAVWVGGLVTGVLVEIGEQVLDRLLINSQVSSLYGTSGALILVLLFVFYSALIFYYGASFTRQYAQWIHLAAEPAAHAVSYQIKEVDSDGNVSLN